MCRLQKRLISPLNKQWQIADVISKKPLIYITSFGWATVVEIGEDFTKLQSKVHAGFCKQHKTWAFEFYHVGCTQLSWRGKLNYGCMQNFFAIKIIKKSRISVEISQLHITMNLACRWRNGLNWLRLHWHGIRRAFGLQWVPWCHTEQQGVTVKIWSRVTQNITTAVRRRCSLLSLVPLRSVCLFVCLSLYVVPKNKLEVCWWGETTVRQRLSSRILVMLRVVKSSACGCKYVWNI